MQAWPTDKYPTPRNRSESLAFEVALLVGRQKSENDDENPLAFVAVPQYATDTGDDGCKSGDPAQFEQADL